MSFQHNIIDSKLLEQAIRTRDSWQGAAAGDEKAFMSSARATATSKTQASDHHRRLHSLHSIKANPNAIDKSAHLDAQLNRWAAAFGGGERRIFAAIRSKESAMMNVHLADGAVKLRSETTHKLKLATIFKMSQMNERTQIRIIFTKKLSTKNC